RNDGTPARGGLRDDAVSAIRNEDASRRFQIRLRRDGHAAGSRSGFHARPAALSARERVELVCVAPLGDWRVASGWIRRNGFFVLEPDADWSGRAAANAVRAAVDESDSVLVRCDVRERGRSLRNIV